MVYVKSLRTADDYFVLLQTIVIKCHLSRLMGERRLKIAEVARDTGINRGTLTRVYYETAERIDLDVIDRLCAYLGCAIGDLLEFVPAKPGNGQT